MRWRGKAVVARAGLDDRLTEDTMDWKFRTRWLIRKQLSILMEPLVASWYTANTSLKATTKVFATLRMHRVMSDVKRFSRLAFNQWNNEKKRKKGIWRITWKVIQGSASAKYSNSAVITKDLIKRESYSFVQRQKNTCWRKITWGEHAWS